MKKGKKKVPKICFVSSSGGHYEEIKQLTPLLEKYNGFFVTEKTDFLYDVPYIMISTGSNDKFVIPKMIIMFLQGLYIWIKEKPDFVISTGALISVPFLVFCKLCRKKMIYIETFARMYDGSKTGKFMYKYADLFLIQWESLHEVYPNAIYGGSIF